MNPSMPLIDWQAAKIRFEKIIDVMENRYIHDGFKLDRELADPAMAWIERKAAGPQKDTDVAEEMEADEEGFTAFIEFMSFYGQSLDYVFLGDEVSMIARLADWVHNADRPRQPTPHGKPLRRPYLRIVS